MPGKLQDEVFEAENTELIGFANGKPQGDLQVARPVYRQEELHEASNYSKPTTNLRDVFNSKLHSINCFSICISIIPLLSWLPNYKFKQNIISDIICGITVAIMHIPQGIAYGLLGNVHPVVGMYMAFFPVLIYFVFGTSRHISIGTFAIICLMTGQVVATYSNGQSFDMDSGNSSIGNNTIQPFTSVTGRQYTPIEVATAITFAVAVFEMLMYVLRLGVFTNLLSETLVNGFTTAAAIHVVSSQLKDLFGLNLARRKGYFRVALTFYDALLAVPQANRAAVSISMVAIVIMVINNEICKPRLARITRIPFPIELAAIVMGTAVCYTFDFNLKYGLNIVGEIPTGLPAPALPPFSLMPYIAVDSFIIAIVSYTITISMAFIFAQKAHYEVNANQELLALSLSNFFGSFFSTMPVSAALARSSIQYNVGGVTQIASIVSAFLILIVLLWIGPIFETLPKCILASIIVVSLKSLLVQATMLKKYWKLSKWDALVWVITFLTTVLISLDIGLLSGIIISLLSIFVQGHRPYTCLLGVVPNTDLYLDCKRYKGVQEIEGIKIFHYSGALHFASKAMFKEQLAKKIGFDPAKVLAKQDDVKCNGEGKVPEQLLVRCIILDFSAVTYVDPVAAQMLRTLAEECKKLGVSLYITNCSGPIFEMLAKCDKYEGKKSLFNIYPTIHDAVLYAKLNET
ncbi:hypothetical protein Trydic_g9253 [Trypoxylus dichotomus]